MVSSTFTFSLLKQVAENVGNVHQDNWESRRCAVVPTRPPIPGLDAPTLSGLGYSYVQDIAPRVAPTLASIEPELPRLERTYALLENEESRDLMARLFAYVLLGHERVRLPSPTPDYVQRLAELDGMAEPLAGVVSRVFEHELALSLFDLGHLGRPIRLAATSLGIYTIYIAEQYAYRRDGVSIAANMGDTVLDVGGCWGDAALDFADRVGDGGAVVSFEFGPSNLEVFSRNRERNPQLAKRIRIVEHAAWSSSGERLDVSSQGPATSVVSPDPGSAGEFVESLSIDDLVSRDGLTVDFIKMDIEGSELAALRGAETTLRNQRPKLAISVYHKLVADFAEIPEYLDSLGLGYRFYLKNATIFECEVVLFAEATNRGAP